MLLASTATQESTKLSEVARQNDKVIRMYNVADGGPAHGGVQLRSQVAQEVPQPSTGAGQPESTAAPTGGDRPQPPETSSALPSAAAYCPPVRASDLHLEPPPVFAFGAGAPAADASIWPSPQLSRTASAPLPPIPIFGAPAGAVGAVGVDATGGGVRGAPAADDDDCMEVSSAGLFSATCICDGFVFDTQKRPVRCIVRRGEPKYENIDRAKRAGSMHNSSVRKVAAVDKKGVKMWSEEYLKDATTRLETHRTAGGMCAGVLRAYKFT